MDEVAATVFGVAGFGGFHTERFFFAPTGGVETAFGDAEADEILHDCVGATRTESEIVLGGAAFVAVTFNGNCPRGVLFEDRGIAIESERSSAARR